MKLMVWTPPLASSFSQTPEGDGQSREDLLLIALTAIIVIIANLGPGLRHTCRLRPSTFFFFSTFRFLLILSMMMLSDVLFICLNLCHFSLRERVDLLDDLFTFSLNEEYGTICFPVIKTFKYRGFNCFQ